MTTKYLTAAQAAVLTNEANQYAKYGTALTSILESIAKTAHAQGTEYVCEGVGAMVDFQGLKTALQQLGYTVQDISGTATQSGSRWLERSLKIEW